MGAPALVETVRARQCIGNTSPVFAKRAGNGPCPSRTRACRRAASAQAVGQAARGAHQEWVYPVVLTLLDTGARLGEARGLCWSQVGWGDDLGRGRHLLIDRSIPSGLTSTEETKSGYIRKVQLSKRLRAALLERYVEQGQPSAESRVFPSFNGDNFRRREWADICGKKGAGIGHRQIKDLRDSYASLLLSAGIPLAFVSKQLGHQSMQLTERHYARYMPDGDEYQAPEPLARGEVPADLLARLPERAKRPKFPKRCRPERNADNNTEEFRKVAW